MAGFRMRAGLAWKAATGVFSEDSAKQAWGMLSGIMPGGLGSPPARGTREYLRAYSEMPWLRAVAGRVATAVAATEWQLYVRKRGGERARRDWTIQRAADPARRRQLLKLAKEEEDLRQIEEHQLLDVLHSANSFQTGEAMRKVTQLHIDLVGEAFWLKERDGLGTIVAVWPVPPDWVINTPTPANPYYRVNFRGWRGMIPDSEFLWFSDPDPSNPYARGTGTAQALADELETDEYAAKHMKAFFFNRARPDFLIYPKQGQVRSEQVQRLEEDWLSRAQGFWRAFKPYFMTREVGIHEFQGSDLRKLQMVQLREFERSTIIQVFGVPPELLGVLENSNRATINAADYLFARYVVQPRLEFMRAFLQERLVPEYDERLIIDYVSPVQKDEEMALKAAQAAPWSRNVDEWRELQDLPRLEDEKGAVHVFPNTVREHTMGEEDPVPPGFDPTSRRPLSPDLPPTALEESEKSRQERERARQEAREDAREARREQAERKPPPKMAALAKSLFDAGAAEHKGLLVSLWLDGSTSAQLAVPGGEPADSLHVTLCYCGDVAALGDVRVAAALVAADEVARRFGPMEGRVGGVGRFTASPQSGAKEVVYAVPDVPGLAELRAALATAVAGAGAPARTDHGWTPHITLAYVEPGAAGPTSVPALRLGFSAVTVSVGDKRVALPLRGSEGAAKAVAALRKDLQAAAMGDAGGDAELAAALFRAAADDPEDLSAASREAAAQEPALVRALVAGWEEAAAGLSLGPLEAAGGDAESMAVLVQPTEQATARAAEEPLRLAFLRGVRLGAEPLREAGVVVREAGLTIDLEAMNPEAAAWARRHAGALVQAPAVVRERIRQMVIVAQEQGVTWRELARMVQFTVGLTPQQALAVANFRGRLQAQGLAADALEARVRRYATAQHRLRAVTIARTELIASTNGGQQALWESAERQGVLDGARLRRTWIVTLDERLEPECEALDGRTVGLHEPFTADGVMYPPLHPRCRCAVGLTRT
jgi:HK97 family phage portal protein